MKIRLIEVPMDFGASRRGVNVGPTALRLAGIKEKLMELGHQPEEDEQPIFVPIQEIAQEYDSTLKFLPAILAGCRKLAQRVEATKQEGLFPLVMGGDHSIAVGTLAGLGAYYRAQGIRWGVVWLDAHGDYNTPETSPSGNIHGMPLAASTGIGSPELTGLHGDFTKVDPSHVVIIGLRDVDLGERQNLKNQKVKTFTMADIDRKGIDSVMAETLEYLKQRVDVIHLSFDVDSLDPTFAPGVGTPVPGGLTYREAHFIMEHLAASGMVGSAEVVEVNPILDIQNKTAETAVEMIASLLGKTIL